MTVLIVDDFAPLRRELSNIIRDSDSRADIICAATADEALDMFARHSPGVVVLDIRLPDGNGMDVLRRMKDALPETVVIMITNYPYDQYRQKCMAAGANYFFDKSRESEELAECLRQLCSESETT